MTLVGTNPYALGHMVNHPPAGAAPNVHPFSFNFPLSFPDAASLRNLIPNRFIAENPVWFPGDRILMKSLTFISTKYMKDEEVFFKYTWLLTLSPQTRLSECICFFPRPSYRYNPSLDAPAWYAPVDLENDRRFWSGAPKEEN